MSIAPRVTLVIASAALAMSAASLALVMVDVWTDARLIRGKGKVSAPPLPSQPDPATRVLFPREAHADSVHTNEMISLTHNWTWSESNGWSRLDFAEPSVALTVESWFNGLAELNFDVRPPREYTAWPGGRPFGLFAKHDGTYASLFLGGAPYSKNAAGIQLTGGVTADPIVSISEAREGREATIIRVDRPDRAPRLLVAGGDAPGIAFGLSGDAANAGQTGVLRFTGNPTNGALIDAVQISQDAHILAATPSEATTSRFAIHADGRMTWGGAAAGRRKRTRSSAARRKASSNSRPNSALERWSSARAACYAACG